MSTRKRKNKAPLPALNAGLLRFFEDDTPSFRTNVDIIIRRESYFTSRLSAGPSLLQTNERLIVTMNALTSQRTLGARLIHGKRFSKHGEEVSTAFRASPVPLLNRSYILRSLLLLGCRL